MLKKNLFNVNLVALIALCVAFTGCKKLEKLTGGKNGSDTAAADGNEAVEDGDTPAPEGELQVTPDKSSLWPPNHKMEKVSMKTSHPDAVCKIESVASNEPGIEDDHKILEDMVLELRAEREGKGKGRIYSVSLACSVGDQATAKVAYVVVPHDNDKGKKPKKDKLGKKEVKTKKNLKKVAKGKRKEK
jgi:hypothetical protein